MKVLVVEDDRRVGATVVRGLQEAGHDSELVSTASDGVHAARASHYDAIVLDVMLGGGEDGFSVCRRLRDSGNDSRIIMLTARDGIGDRVEGLDSGADDYLIKPFAFKELLARLRALNRRNYPKPAQRLQVGNVVIDNAARTVRAAEQTLSLTRREFDLLTLLAQSKATVVTRQMIEEVVWQGSDPDANLIDVYMSRIRRALARAHADVMVTTVRGVGYKLELEDK